MAFPAGFTPGYPRLSPCGEQAHLEDLTHILQALAFNIALAFRVKRKIIHDCA